MAQTEGRHPRWPPAKARLKTLIAEATVDAYDETEQRMGFYTLIEDNLALPFGIGVIACSGFAAVSDRKSPERTRKDSKSYKAPWSRNSKRRFPIHCRDITSADRRRNLSSPHSRFSRPPPSTTRPSLRVGN